MLGSRII